MVRRGQGDEAAHRQRVSGGGHQHGGQNQAGRPVADGLHTPAGECHGHAIGTVLQHHAARSNAAELVLAHQGIAEASKHRVARGQCQYRAGHKYGLANHGGHQRGTGESYSQQDEHHAHQYAAGHTVDQLRGHQCAQQHANGGGGVDESGGYQLAATLGDVQRGQQ